MNNLTNLGGNGFNFNKQQKSFSKRKNDSEEFALENQNITKPEYEPIQNPIQATNDTQDLYNEVPFNPAYQAINIRRTTPLRADINKKTQAVKNDPTGLLHMPNPFAKQL